MGATFDPSRLAVVDVVGTNYLIRGNMPLIGSDLHYALKEIIAASGVPDLSTKKFLSISTIDNVGERDSWAAEMQAFGVDPNLFPTDYWPLYLQKGYNSKALLGTSLTTEGRQLPGSIIWWPFEGLPAGEDSNVYLNSPGWNLSGLVDYVIYLLSTLSNAIIYDHCMLGADRTGAFIIGYLMRAHGLSYPQALAKNNAMTSAGAPSIDYQRLATAYAKQIGA